MTPSISWPDSLVHCIADRRCVLFLGAGLSATATPKDPKSTSKIPDWDTFLQAANKSLINDATLQRDIDELLAQKNNLLALQAIYDHADSADYNKFLSDRFNNQLFKQSAIHETIYNLDSRIVITTNFDKIYDTYCQSTDREDGYKIITYYNEDLCDAVRSGTYVIIKAHGTIDEPSKMIFTQRQYTSARYTQSHFYNTLKALFTVYTVVFIGCSLSDPDMLLLLEEVKHTGQKDAGHYMFACGVQKEIQVKHIERNFGVKQINYGSTHADLEGALNDLFDRVDAIRSSRV